MADAIRIKRAYDPPEPGDGLRVLVDRIWPRGITKQKAKIDLWLKDAAPTTELRKWFDHDPKKWDEFRRRYFRELAKQKRPLQQLLDEAEAGRVTLVFAAKDIQHNNAVALKEYLDSLRSV